MMTDELNIKLANSYEIVIDNHDGDVCVALINPNDYIISDLNLMEEQVEALRRICRR